MWIWNTRIPFEQTAYYHIYNRWYNKSIIFNNEHCFNKFYSYLSMFLKEFQEISLISYCFLPNHFHLIIQNFGTGTEVSDFMKKLQWSYSIWHRIKYPIDWKLPFFEWRFKAKFIDSDEYLYQCMAYVNYNALKHWIVSDIENHPWSSYHTLTNKGIFEPYREMKMWELEF